MKNYKQANADIEAMDMLKDDYYNKEVDNDTTRDMAIRCVNTLVKEGYVKDCTDTNDTTEFSIQDIIHKEINKVLKVSEDDDDIRNCNIEEDTCPKCDQHPYSDTDKHCPVCYQEINGTIDNESNDTCPMCNKEIVDHSICHLQ